MEYMLAIFRDDEREPQADTPEFADKMRAFGAFAEEVPEKGLLRSANALEGPSTAPTVRVRSGKTQITDGPFAESKEQLGGYYILDCQDLDEAIAYAAKIPSAQTGSIEIRPVKVLR